MTKDVIIKVVIASLAVLAIAGAGFGVSWWMAQRHYQPTIDKLNKLLTTCSAEKRQQSAGIAAQNNGIAALETLRELREKAAKAKRAESDAAASSDYAQANTILSERVTGPDLCAEAADAFDEELKRERAE